MKLTVCSVTMGFTVCVTMKLMVCSVRLIIEGMRSRYVSAASRVRPVWTIRKDTEQICTAASDVRTVVDL